MALYSSDWCAMRFFPHTFALLLLASPASAQVLPKQELLNRETFWDNKDFDWYQANIPFFECPDADIQTTYYYRWELVTKHLTYGSPNTGYTFTEFIDRPFWSGTYGAISCPAGHQLYEARWLRDPQYARDFARYWFRTPGAQPRNYSTWLADSVWALHHVHPDAAFTKGLLPDLMKNHEGWEKRHFVADVGLFWQTGHDDGMEYNINSRQTKDIVRGAPGYRPTLNAYLWADELAIARVADLAGEKDTAAAYRAKAAALKENLQTKLWDAKRQFYFHRFKQDEEANGVAVKGLTLTHQSGKFAGDPHGRELIGYVPWQFSLPDAGKGYEVAWKKLMDKDGFAAPFGPTTVERNDPMFALKNTCCWWSGQSWPYATAQTLKAMANLLQEYRQDAVTPADYVKLLTTYAKTHRKNGKPYLAEACHPDTGSWEGHDSYNHSEHYFHSSYCDLVITGLVGLRPRDDDTVEVHPLAPADWPYFALDGVPYRGQTLSIVWDRDGTRYKFGKGLHLLANNTVFATRQTLGPLTGKLPPMLVAPPPREVELPGQLRLALKERLGWLAERASMVRVNVAVNNEGTYYPRVRTSYSNPKTPPAKLIDGNYWYHRDPPNRWTCEGSPNEMDWVEIDFGKAREVDTVKLYFLDDGQGVVPPTDFTIFTWKFTPIWDSNNDEVRVLQTPTGHRANVIHLKPHSTNKIRIEFKHAANGKTGLTEIEAWGPAKLPVEPAPPPAGNLAYNSGDKPFPKATASHTSRFDKVEMANDGKVSFTNGPHNRWTSYESPNATDWLQIDFGEEKQFSRVELALYDDRGGVQTPTKYDVQYWDGKEWKDVANAKQTPEKPAGGQFNEVTFDRVKASKVRVVFTHAGKARSGVSEIFVWQE